MLVLAAGVSCWFTISSGVSSGVSCSALCCCVCLCVGGFWADRTALHEAASLGRALQLQQLIDGGASVNTVTVDNITPLHEACIQNHPACARLLLQAGAQVSRPDLRGDQVQ